ncbi:MAG: DNRLRE domain-containing protein [Luteolibacter sp.]
MWANQRQDLQEAAGLQVREYTVGDFDEFAASDASIPANAAWLATASTLGSLTGFDDLTAGRWHPWTHDVSLSPGEQVVSATLSISLRGLSSSALSGKLYVGDTGHSIDLSSLTATLPTTGSTVVKVNLAAYLSLLGSGRLNLAVGPDAAIDWSVLELRVAPTSVRPVISLAPEADAMVRAVSPYADQVQDNGTGTTISVKGTDSTSNVTRRALLRWNLSNITRPVVHASIRLTPTSVSTTGIENAMALLDSNSWTEAATTWNNQPGSGQRFASWNPQAGKPVEITVTSEVKAALATNGMLGVQLFAAINNTSNDLTSYASRENSDPTRVPVLLVTTWGGQETWRQQYFGSPDATGDAADSADPDGDGIPNREEYALGTNPLVRNETPRARNLRKDGQAFAASLDGRSGRTYIFERSADLSTASWQEVSRTGPLTDDGTVELTDSQSPATRSFYRIRVVAED